MSTETTPAAVRPAIFATASVSTSDSGQLLCGLVAYHDAEGRLWCGTEAGEPGLVVDVTALARAGLVVVQVDGDGWRELYICPPNEWHAVKAEARPLPPLETFGDFGMGHPLPLLSQEERDRMIADTLCERMRAAVIAEVERQQAQAAEK